jgi:pimeloyl-ACP methyl ester carboxylesterase
MASLNFHDRDRIQATRLDQSLGIREEIAFVGPPSARLFCCSCTPMDRTPTYWLLMCPSLYADFTLNYRREVILARILASRGVAVQRFHYRGTGNSDGEASDVTLSSLVEDTARLAELMADDAPTGPILLGTRWGGLVAASAAAAVCATGLVLWEPVIEPGSYLREGLRAQMCRAVAARAASPVTPSRLSDHLRTFGSVDVLGYSLQGRLHDSSRALSLQTAIPLKTTDTPPVLLLVPGSSKGMPRDYQALVATWLSAGVDVRAETLSASAAWWFFGQHALLAESTANEVASLVESWAPASVA